MGTVAGMVLWTFAEIRHPAIFPDHLRSSVSLQLKKVKDKDLEIKRGERV